MGMALAMQTFLCMLFTQPHEQKAKVPQMHNVCYTLVKSGDKQNPLRSIKAAFQQHICD